MCVDLTLFPLDTIKTRLQSQQGFYKAGGFKGIYAGVPSAAVGSFPIGERFTVGARCLVGLKVHCSFLLHFFPTFSVQSTTFHILFWKKKYI